MVRIGSVIINFFILLWACSAFAFGPGVMQMGGPADAGTGQTCSGDATDGDNESFESGTDAFCTTDWNLSDTDGVIDTYDTSAPKCGSYNLKIESSSSNTSNNKAYVDLGATDANIYERFYVTLPTMASGQYIRFHGFNQTLTDPLDGVGYLQWYNASGTYKFVIRSSAVNTPTWFNLTPGDQYMVDIHWIQGGTCVMKVYDSSGTVVNDNLSASQMELTGNDSASRYITFNDPNSTTASVNVYIDDHLVDVDGTSFIGAITCD